MKKNAILTTLSDSRHPDFSSRPEVDVFFKSVSIVPNADLLVIADEVRRPIPFIKCPPSENIILDRWLYYYQILTNAQYENVLLIDSRDVYFQTDPFVYANNTVMLTSEGLTHAESEWNTEDQKLSQQTLGMHDEFSSWPVVNGGVVLGPTAKVRAYCLLVYTNARKSATHTDQAAINRLWNLYLSHDSDYSLADPNNDSFCMTGDTLKTRNIKVPTQFVRNQITTAAGKPYALFHQWERTEYRDTILHAFR